jgi:predicted helicase
MGIDIVARTSSGKYVAIQCKYRKKQKGARMTPNGKFPIKNIVTHKDVSTFNALCDRTGPRGAGWARQIVITNCNGVNRQGRKKDTEVTIAGGTFSAIDKGVWHDICGDKGHTLTEEKEVLETPVSEQTVVDTRAKRLAWLDKL